MNYALTFILSGMLLIAIACTAPAKSTTPAIRYYMLNSKTIKIAVIDTGIDLNNVKVNICEGGLIDVYGTGIQDTEGHGQNIAHAIASHLKDKNYCIYIIKYTEGANTNREETIKAFKMAKSLGVHIVNYSAGGLGVNMEEYNVLKDMTATIVTAAGNNHQDLSENCNYFPACYDLKNIIVIGSISDDRRISRFSNYGKYIDYWYPGEHQFYGGSGRSGTSQATAHATGMIVKRWLK